MFQVQGSFLTLPTNTLPSRKVTHGIQCGCCKNTCPLLAVSLTLKLKLDKPEKQRSNYLQIFGGERDSWRVEGWTFRPKCPFQCFLLYPFSLNNILLWQIIFQIKFFSFPLIPEKTTCISYTTLLCTKLNHKFPKANIKCFWALFTSQYSPGLFQELS